MLLEAAIGKAIEKLLVETQDVLLCVVRRVVGRNDFLFLPVPIVSLFDTVPVARFRTYRTLTEF